MAVIKKHLTTIVLFALLLVLAVWSLFIGVLDVELSGLLQGDREHLEVFLISRLPRLLAILCTGAGMSVAGLIMQQLCMNKFVSPTTGATISSAQFGILLALLFMPNSTLWGRAIFSFAFAVLGTWIFVWFIQRIQFKDVVMVPLVGIMFGNVIGGITNYLAYKYEMTQALSTWLVGHFSMVLRGRYEIVWLTVPLVVLAFLFANHFNIVGMGKDFSQNLGKTYTNHFHNRPYEIKHAGILDILVRANNNSSGCSYKYYIFVKNINFRKYSKTTWWSQDWDNRLVSFVGNLDGCGFSVVDMYSTYGLLRALPEIPGINTGEIGRASCRERVL